MKRGKQKVKVLDLFAGAGGFGLGFTLADPQYKLICSLEIDKWAVDTLKANNDQKQKIICGNIRDFDTPDKIRKACRVRPDIIIGGPPCQGFSSAGPPKDINDPRNSLFQNYAQWVEVLKPKIFVMENVQGILTRKNIQGESVIEIIKDTFKAIGYSAVVWELNAANYGVPQHRKRVFIVGTNNKAELPKPPITHYLPIEKKQLNGHAFELKEAIKVIDAIGDLPKLKAGQGKELSEYSRLTFSDFQREMKGGSTILNNHVTMLHSKRLVSRYKQILGGADIEDMEDDLRVRKRSGNGDLSEVDYNSNYRHLKPRMVSYTIPASFYSSFVHPNQPRNLTSREAARLQSFPDYYVFKGKRTQVSSKLLKRLNKEDQNYLSQYNQIGNAVPPFLARAIARHLLPYLQKIKKKRIDQ
jgi:DNA (cytosine-5)-methyltransferase 1